MISSDPLFRYLRIFAQYDNLYLSDSFQCFLQSQVLMLQQRPGSTVQAFLI